MKPTERRAKAKAELRTKILDAARGLFAARGCDAVTMREIARQVGYTATALYYHFPDKDSLLRELCETDFRALVTYFKRLGKVADPVERIRKTSMAYVNFGLEYPQLYRFMFMTPRVDPKPEEVGIEHGNPDQDAYAFLLHDIQQAIEAGRFRPELTDANLLAQTFWAATHGLVALHLTMTSDHWVDWRPARKTAELLTDCVLRGMLRA
jgi:AcrR family transcriptional regulator